MANTYTQLLIHFVFAVKGRQNLILEKNRNAVERYICGIVSNMNSKPLSIYCNPDHCHVLIGLHPTISVSKIAGDMKANSSRWINENRMIPGKFERQEGFGAFSYGRSQLDAVVKYILSQPEHHMRYSFRDEYLEFLEKFQIDHHGEYLFDFLE
jgi:REP element-mobilizing transposase RayT